MADSSPVCRRGGGHLRLWAALASAALAGACSTTSPGTAGQAGTSGSGSGGMTGGAGTGSGSAGNGTPGTAGGGAGTTGTTGVAGTTGAGTAGTLGTTGVAGTTGAGTAGASGRGGTAGAGTAGRGGTTGGAGTGVDVGNTGLGGMPVVACQAPIAITAGTAATVTANLGTVRQTVSPDLMGVHTSVYDSNMQLASTPQLLKLAGVTSLRYPGGSYSDLYHWELNTGTWTPASGGGSNTVYIANGTDFGHFIAFMAAAGANALITVNYGMNSQGTGPGVPQEAAAWVAYANGATTNTTSIGPDGTGTDWKTVGYWASMRAAAPLATDDGFNFLRISHPAPVGIKYWEVGNEIYGNGYYYGACGWEADMHVAYPAAGGTTCTGRQTNAMLSPATYGAGVKAFALAMKAVDPSIKVGGIVAWPTATQYQAWNMQALTAMCANIDFVVEHWYAGKTLTGLLTVPETDIPMMFSQLRTTLSTAAYNCPANIPIAVTEWGPNTGTGNVVIPMSTATAAPAGSQVLGLFAAESYANFMEQGALAVHWLELHNNSYLAGVDATNDPFTTANDSPRWGFHGAWIAHYLAAGNDKVVQATVSNGGALQTLLKAHASLHANGSVSVMVTNTSPSTAANVTVNVTGGGTTLACVGARYAYTPVNSDQDGSLAYAPIFASTDGLSVPVAVPPYSTVVVVFPKK